MSALTKMFVVLQLVFSLVLAVLLALMVSKQENYRDVANNALAGQAASAVQLNSEEQQVSAVQLQANDAQKKLADAITNLTDARAQAASLQGTLEATRAQADTAANAARLASDNLTTENSTLTAAVKAKDDELGKLRPEVEKYLKENEVLTRDKNEAINENRAAELAIRKLQEQIATLQSQTAPSGAAPAGGEGPVASLTAGSGTVGAINAKISDVRQLNGRTLVEMPLGSRDGIQSGTRMMIYRDNTYITDAVVNEVTPDSSVAAVLGDTPQKVKMGDMISTVGR